MPSAEVQVLLNAMGNGYRRVYGFGHGYPNAANCPSYLLRAMSRANDLIKGPCSMTNSWFIRKVSRALPFRRMFLHCMPPIIPRLVPSSRTVRRRAPLLAAGHSKPS